MCQGIINEAFYAAGQILAVLCDQSQLLSLKTAVDLQQVDIRIIKTLEERAGQEGYAVVQPHHLDDEIPLRGQHDDVWLKPRLL